MVDIKRLTTKDMGIPGVVPMVAAILNQIYKTDVKLPKCNVHVSFFFFFFNI